MTVAGYANHAHRTLTYVSVFKAWPWNGLDPLSFCCRILLVMEIARFSIRFE